MVPGSFKESASRFDQRFFVMALLPSAIFLPACGLVVLISTGSLDAAVGWYSAETVVNQVIAWFLAGAAIWFVGVLLSTQWANIVRLYEGYPALALFARLNQLSDRLPRTLTKPMGVAAHQRRAKRLRAKAVSQRADQQPKGGGAYQADFAGAYYDDYPSDLDRVLPTRLGNILRSAEDYAEERYGFEIIYLWPRLALVLPKELIAEIERAMTAYQTSLVISFGCAVTTCVSLVGLPAGHLSNLLYNSLTIGTGVAGWVAYRASFRSAKDYCELLRSAVDLYRRPLVERWWPDLLAVDDDRVRLHALRDFVVHGDPPVVKNLVGASRGGTLYVVGNGLDETGCEKSEPVLSIAAGRVRLAWLPLLAAAAFWMAGFSSLNKPVGVLVAKGPIAGYEVIADRTLAVKRRRGSVPKDALRPADAGNASLVLVALRSIADDRVLLTRDVLQLPGLALPARTIYLERSAAELRRLGLAVGDIVQLDGVVPLGCDSASATSPLTSAAPTAVRTIELRVVEVGVDNRSGRGSVVALAAAANPLTDCTVDLSAARVVRAVRTP